MQYVIMLQGGEYGGLAGTSLIFFGYFTILTNILVAMAFSVSFLKTGGTFERFFQKQSVRASIALYILVVCIVYYSLLAQIHETEGVSAILNLFLHFILPVLYLMDWVFFAPKGEMSYQSLPFWVVYPFVYGIGVIIQGALTGFYPYPFLNIAEIGFGAVVINMFGFMCVYALGGAGFIWLGRVLTRGSKQPTT